MSMPKFTVGSMPKSGDELTRLNQQLESLTLDEFLRWSLDAFEGHIAHVTSFGPSGLVILDHLLRLKPDLHVMTIDTQFLFGETYDLWKAIEQHYNIHIDVVATPVSPQEQVRQYGPHLWESDPDTCCDVRKVRPLGMALSGLHAWYTGVRRDQSSTRSTTLLVGWDERYQLFKLSPLAGWTRQRVWEYIRAQEVPYNRLHDEGYSSIGCVYCTHAADNSEDERAGRWAGKQKVECGLHWPLTARGGEFA